MATSEGSDSGIPKKAIALRDKFLAKRNVTIGDWGFSCCVLGKNGTHLYHIEKIFNEKELGKSFQDFFERLSYNSIEKILTENWGEKGCIQVFIDSEEKLNVTSFVDVLAKYMLDPKPNEKPETTKLRSLYTNWEKNFDGICPAFAISSDICVRILMRLHFN